MIEWLDIAFPGDTECQWQSRSTKSDDARDWIRGTFMIKLSPPFFSVDMRGKGVRVCTCVSSCQGGVGCTLQTNALTTTTQG